MDGWMDGQTDGQTVGYIDMKENQTSAVPCQQWMPSELALLQWLPGPQHSTCRETQGTREPWALVWSPEQ